MTSSLLLILKLTIHYNCTTIPHMRVGPSVWGPPSFEELLCSCCIGVVNLTFSFVHTFVKQHHITLLLTARKISSSTGFTKFFYKLM
jgi:hypothetical protein